MTDESLPIRRKSSRLKRRVMWTLLVLFLLVVVLPFSLYIPFVQDFVCQQVVSVFNRTNPDLKFEVGKVRLGFPFKLKVTDVSATRRSDGLRVFHFGRLQTALDDLPINQPYFVVKNLSLEDVALSMDSLTTSFGMVGTLSCLTAQNVEIDPASSQILASSIHLNNPDFQLCIGPSVPDTDDVDRADWLVSVSDLHISEGHIKLDMSHESLCAALRVDSDYHYFDYNHLDVSGFGFQANDIFYHGDTVYADVRGLTALEQHSGLEVGQMQVRFRMEQDRIAAHQLQLRMPHSEIEGDAEINLQMFDSLHQGWVDLRLQAVLDSLDVIRLGAPYVHGLVQYWTHGQTQVEVQGRLSADTLDLRNLSVDIPGRAELKAEAFGLCPFDHQSRSLAATLKGSLPQADPLLTTFIAAPEHRAYRLPDAIHFSAEVSQRQSRLSSRLEVQNAAKESLLNAGASYELTDESYHINAESRDLVVSDFVPLLGIGALTFHAQADGRHFDFPSKRTRLEATLTLDTIRYLSPEGRLQHLQDIEVAASLLGGQYVADVQSKHPDLQVDTHLEGICLKDTLSAEGHLNLTRAVLNHLPMGLARPDLGTLSFCSDFSGDYNWGDYAELQLSIEDVHYEDEYVKHHFDSIVVSMDAEPGIIDADIFGGDASLCLKVKRSLTELPERLDVFLTEVNRQISDIRLDVNALQSCLPEMDIDFHMAQDNPFYTAVRHFGYGFTSVDCAAHNDEILSLEGLVVDLTSQDRSIDFDTLTAQIQPLRKGGGYDFYLHALHIDPKAADTYDVHLGGKLMPDSLLVGLEYMNGKYITMYNALASVAMGDDTLTVHFEKDPILYGLPFSVNPDNYIRLMQFRHMEELKANTRARLMLSGPNGMSLQLLTRKAPDRETGNQLLMRLRDLDLSLLSKTLAWEDNIGGRLDLVAQADLFPDSLASNISSGIRLFHLGEYHADTLAFDGTFHAAHKRRDMAGILTIEDLIKLQLNANLADTIEARARIADFPLALTNLFLPSNIDLGGSTSGELQVHGKDIETARLDGFVTMKSGEVRVSDLDARLLLPADTLRLRNNRLRIRDYQIMAANEHPLTLRGSVDLRESLSNPVLNLSLSGERVNLIDNIKLRLPDQYIHGILPVTTDIQVAGKSSELKVSGTLHVLSGTKLNFYLKEDPLESTSRVENLVEFVNFRQLDRQLARTQHTDRPLLVSHDEGPDIQLNIQIDRDARIKAVLPGMDNNYVNIIGGGGLNMRCASDGSLTMSGVYDINGGTVDYKLPVLPMAKTFKINTSSNVSWNGVPPGGPDIYIQAVEQVKTTVSDQSGSRIVRFDVTITISGSLDALDIAFTCDAPDDGPVSDDIKALNDEERSKAAIMLLVAQTYIGPGNSSAAGLGTANAAINSMLNREMDALFGSKLKSTDIDLGIDIYDAQSGNTRTDYSVKVSQRFFNDRFRATIGGKVTSGGEVGQRNGAQLDDMSLEWLIKKDGTRYLKLFRKTNFESVLEGEVVETGISYVQESSAYKFRHLLIPTSRKRQERIQQVIRELQEKEKQEQRRHHPHHQNNPNTKHEYPNQTQSADSLTVVVPESIPAALPDSLQHH